MLENFIGRSPARWVTSVFSRRKLEDVFTPETPVADDKLFAGRERPRQLFEDAMRSKGAQVVIYGELGAGKTSLAESALSAMGWQYNRIQCEAISGEDELYRAILHRYGESRIVQETQSREQTMQGGLSTVVTASGTATDRSGIIRGPYASRPLTQDVVDVVGRSGIVCILDDFEKSVGNRDEMSRAASFLGKVAADFGNQYLRARFIVIGAADTALKLIPDPVSSRYREIHVPLMTREELTQIIQIGERQTGFRFQSDVVRRIVYISNGYPKFVHLLCLHAGRAAERRGRRQVVTDDLEEAIRDAVEVLRRQYEDAYHRAVRSNAGSRGFHRHVVHAMAGLEGERNTTEQIVEAVRRLTDDPQIKVNQLRNALYQLQNVDRAAVLKRYEDSVGVYGFRDLMFKAYVRLRCEQERGTVG